MRHDVEAFVPPNLTSLGDDQADDAAELREAPAAQTGQASETEFREQATYLIASIRDIQMTIRAIDTKVSILLAALSLPLRYTNDLFGDIRGGHPFSFFGLFTLAGLVFYVASGLAAIRTIAGIGTTVGRVRGSERYNTFFAGGLYRFDLRDAFVNRRSVVSSMSVAEFVEHVPGTGRAIATDLAAEIMALAYIRDLKLRRQSIAFVFAGVAAGIAILRIVM